MMMTAKSPAAVVAPRSVRHYPPEEEEEEEANEGQEDYRSIYYRCCVVGRLSVFGKWQIGGWWGGTKPATHRRCCHEIQE